MGRLENLGCATVSRIYTEFTERKAAERLSLECPLMLGIDEHTLHKKTKFATTFCDLANNRIFDIVEGKSAADLEGFFSKLKGTSGNPKDTSVKTLFYFNYSINYWA